MIAISAGIVLFEMEQIRTSRTFDYYDIIANLIGLGISFIIFNKFSVKDSQEEENILR